MELFFEDSRWLWGLMAVVPLAGLGLMLFQAMAPVRRWVAIVVRALLVGALVALLGGLAMLRETNRLAVVAVVDVSGSVDRFYQPPRNASDLGQRAVRDARDAARQFLEGALSDREVEDLAGLVVFDGQAVAASLPGSGRVWERDLVASGREGTNLGEAIRLGAAIIPPEAAGRLVVISDGNETVGDALGAVREVRSVAGRERRGGLPVDVAPLRYRLTNEVLVEAVDAPPTAPAESTVNVRVVLWATQASSGTLQLLRENTGVDLNGDRPGLGRRVELQAGRNVVQLEVDLGPGRVHRFRAVYEPDVNESADVGGSAARAVFAGDTVLENNQGQAFTISPGKGAVLLVDGVSGGRDGGAGLTLASALRRAGVDVSVVSTELAPTDILALQAYDLVILANVSADVLDGDAQEAYIAFVRDLGGGLVMVGGPDSFGAGGWLNTPLASVLPVELDLPDRIVAPEVATVFVLDNSGSMRRPVLGSRLTQQQIANDAAALAVNSLDRSDLVGVVTFNSAASVLVPLGPNRDSKATVEEVRDISSGGGTDLAEGLERAIDQFEGVQVKTKQCVILTDGKSMREEDIPALVDRLVAMGVRINTIAVGDDADTQILSTIAQRGGGTYFHAINPQSLPRIFLKAVRVVRSPLIREGLFVPAVLPSGSPMISGLRETPELGGLVLTRVRKDPTVVLSMVTPTGEPVLASWQVGLGQVVAFTSDAHDAWAANWLNWPGYERLWSQVVRVASRPADGRGVQATAATTGDSVTLRIDARNEDGSPSVGLVVPATLYEPSGSTKEIMLSAVGPGVYEATVRTSDTGSYVALVKPTEPAREGQPGRRLPPAIVGATVQEGAEFRTLASNDALLETLAREGGGRVLDVLRPQEAAVFDRRGIAPAEAITSLWTVLMVVALGLFLADVATRRVAWDRFISKGFRLPGQELGRGATQIEGLRARVQASDERRQATALLALSEADAQELAAAARDRRREQRLAAAQRVEAFASATTGRTGSGGERDANAGPSRSEGRAQDAAAKGGSAAGADETGLLAAKRRAAKRFDE